MGDHDHRTPLVRRQLRQSLGHRETGSGIEACGRLVGEQDRRVVEQGAGKRDPLLFAARQGCGGAPPLRQREARSNGRFQAR